MFSRGILERFIPVYLMRFKNFEKIYIHILYRFSPSKGVEIKICVFFKFFLLERQVNIVIYIFQKNVFISTEYEGLILVDIATSSG